MRARSSYRCPGACFGLALAASMAACGLKDRSESEGVDGAAHPSTASVTARLRDEPAPTSFILHHYHTDRMGHGSQAAPLMERRNTPSLSLPARPRQAISGYKFLRETALHQLFDREREVFAQLKSGNFPEHLRQLIPIEIKGHIIDTDGQPRLVTALLRVMPDYLSIGSDEDFVRVPMNLYTAADIAREFGLVLPTDRIVDAIHQQAGVRLAPSPLPPTNAMVSNSYVLQHHQIVQDKLGQYALGQLVAGIKKDLVLSNKLKKRFGRIIIYGWHQPDGLPIQPLSDAHHAGYADYSHGVRLVSPLVDIDGYTYHIADLLADWHTASLFSSEGVISNFHQLMQPMRGTRLLTRR